MTSDRKKSPLHKSREWIERRAVVIRRSRVCEWCFRPFGGKVVPQIHHVAGNYNPSTGEGDEEAYLEMSDDEVTVLCRGCHYFWHEYGLKPGDPELTCACGAWKEPQFTTCLRCHRAIEKGMAD